MQVTSFGTTTALALFIASATAQAPTTDGNIGICSSQGCSDCPDYVSVNDGAYPQCEIGQTAHFGQSFASPSGNGYDVWWNSGAPNPSCQIIIRTPASTDLPTCGYFLTSWTEAGCYYTSLQDTFVVQYCCGEGDCDAAAPASSIQDAHEQALQGNTTSVFLPIGELAESESSGKRAIGGVGEFSWKRSDHAYSKRDSIVAEPVERRDQQQRRQDNNECTFNPTSELTTEGGRQIAVSNTEVCNTQNGCSIAVASSVTVGEMINPSLTVNLFMIVAAAVGYTFTESRTYMVTTTYTQAEGTTGYVSYIPTMNCWQGTFSNCYDRNGDDIYRIPDDESFRSCTPALRADGSLDGTFSFVYDN